MIDPSLIEPPNLYWARRKTPAGEVRSLEVVQITEVLGPVREYWSVAVLGSDQHYSLNDFDFIAMITPPADPSDSGRLRLVPDGKVQEPKR